MSTSSDWRKTYRDATEAPHPAVKERVWRGLEPGRPARRAPRWVLAVSATAAVLALAWWLTPRARSVAQAREGYAFVTTGAVFTEGANALSLESGRVVVSAWRAPVVVRAGSSTIAVESAVAVVEVAAERVTVRAIDGVVTMNGVRQFASSERQREDSLDAVRALEPAEAPVLRAEAAAERASQEQRWDDARAALNVVAASGSLRAEAALLKRGELELRRQHDAARALATFDEGDTRFPNGTLAMERALSAIEASVALQQWPQTVARCDRFLSTFPDSHRAEEVRTARSAAQAASVKQP